MLWEHVKMQKACCPGTFHYSKYNPSVLFHPLAGRLYRLQLVNTALHLKSQGDLFPEVEGKLAVSAVPNFYEKKKYNHNSNEQMDDMEQLFWISASECMSQ